MYGISSTIKVSDRVADQIDLLNNGRNQLLRISIIEGECVGKKHAECIDESQFD